MHARRCPGLDAAEGKSGGLCPWSDSCHSALVIKVGLLSDQCCGGPPIEGRGRAMTYTGPLAEASCWPGVGAKARGSVLGGSAFAADEVVNSATFPEEKPQRPAVAKTWARLPRGRPPCRRQAGPPRPAERPARALARPRRTAALHGSSIRNAYVSYLRLFLKERYPDMFKKWLLGFLKHWSTFLRRETEMANPPCPSLEREEAVFSASGSRRRGRPWDAPPATHLGPVFAPCATRPFLA